MQSRACCAPPNASTPPPTGLAGWGAGADSMELCARLQGHTASPQCRTLGDRLRHTLAAQVGDPRGASAALAVALQCVHAGGRREVCSPAPASSRRAAHLQGAIDAYRVQHRLAPARRHSLGLRVAPAVASALAAHYYRAGSLSPPHATPCKGSWTLLPGAPTQLSPPPSLSTDPQQRLHPPGNGCALQFPLSSATGGPSGSPRGRHAGGQAATERHSGDGPRALRNLTPRHDAPVVWGLSRIRRMPRRREEAGRKLRFLSYSSCKLGHRDLPLGPAWTKV